MRAMRWAGTVAATLIVCACVSGKSAADLRLATSPNGARVYLTVPSGSLNGELLEVQRDAAVIQKPDGQIVLAKFGLISRIAAVELGNDYVASGAELTNGKSDRFRIISHFPQGMTDAIRSRMLAAAGQSDVVVVQ